MERHNISAHYLRVSLDLAKIEKKNSELPLFTLVRRERTLLLYETSHGKYVCVFAFGVVVLVGFDDKPEATKLLKRFSHFESEADELPEKAAMDDYAIAIDKDEPEVVDFDQVRLKKMTTEKILLICYTIAQSVAIDYIESQIHESLNTFEAMHRTMAREGKVGVNRKAIIKLLGASGATTHFIINRLSLLDKPDITWEDRDAETLFINLRRMFELDERFKAMRFKMEYVQDSSESILNVLQSKHAAFLEWIIIGLIFYEIVAALFGIM